MKELSERERLLKNARSHYFQNEIPAVHPRYGAIYHNLYAQTSETKSSLGIRVIISLLLFLLFMALEQGYFTDAPFTPTQIIEQIEMPVSVTPQLDYL